MFSARVARTLATTAPVQKKVAVLGAAGGIGQPLALLLKVFSRFFLKFLRRFLVQPSRHRRLMLRCQPRHSRCRRRLVPH